jgi:hypothetical protein
LDPRRTRMESGEGFIMRHFIMYNVKSGMWTDQKELGVLSEL